MHSFILPGQVNSTVLKTMIWFIDAMMTAALIIYQFPIVLIMVLFIFPLLNYATPLFFWNSIRQNKKESRYNLAWFTSIILFVGWLALGISILLGTILFKDVDIKNPLSVSSNIHHVTGLINTSISDYFCVGSNLWVYFCMLFVPNVIVVIQVGLFS